MADILIDNQTVPATPASGKSVLFVDSTTKKLMFLDDTGAIGGRLYHRVSTASQGAGFASDTYITDSGLLVPSFGMKAGMCFKWWISLSKTAAGTAAPVLIIRTGSAQTTGDTTRVTMTSSTAGTAAVAEGLLMVTMIVRSVSASGVVVGSFGHAAAVGLGGGKDVVSGTFDNTAMAGLYVSLSANYGASAAVTITSVQGEIIG
jgi:hypothetical protein